MAKYVHKKGLERTELRNYSPGLRGKVKSLLKGNSVELSEEELKDNNLSGFLKEEKEVKEVQDKFNFNKKKKEGVKENGVK